MPAMVCSGLASMRAFDAGSCAQLARGRHDFRGPLALHRLRRDYSEGTGAVGELGSVGSAGALELEGPTTNTSQ